MWAEADWLGLQVLNKLIQVLTAKRQLTREQEIEDDPATPHIALLRVGASPEYLGSHAVRSAANCLKAGLSGCESTCQAEVNQLDRALRQGSLMLLHQQVIQFQISVSHALTMHVTHRLHDLLEDVPCLPIAEYAGISLQGVCQVTAITHLHDESKLPLLREYLVHPGDVWMVHFRMDLGLTVQQDKIKPGRRIDDLERILPSTMPASSRADNPESTSPEHFADLVAV
mmetsp:Transcript_4032/g.10644  ORF Transcript_4032/g.10644 Transcript_4032/m.10644 type:complete len:228 (+) Transcript_4032:509-1192(+)